MAKNVMSSVRRQLSTKGVGGERQRRRDSAEGAGTTTTNTSSTTSALEDLAPTMSPTAASEAKKQTTADEALAALFDDDDDDEDDDGDSNGAVEGLKEFTHVGPVDCDEIYDEEHGGSSFGSDSSPTKKPSPGNDLYYEADGSSAADGGPPRPALAPRTSSPPPPSSSSSSSTRSIGDSSSVATPVRTNVSSPSPAPPLADSGRSSSSSGGKGVSFAPTPSEASSSALAIDDGKKSREELLKELVEARNACSKAKIDLSAERALRKKKERNLIKLAKQLNLRGADAAEKDLQIQKLVQTQASLETKLESAKSDLDDLTALHERSARNHHAEIEDSQRKLRETSRDRDERISELNASHARKCEELRREILSTNLNADRLRAKLAAAEMRRDPSRADRIAARAMREATSGEESRARRIWRGVGLALSAVAVPALALGYRRGYLSTDGALCAPCLPDTALGPKPARFVAPWWVPFPPAAKGRAFRLACGSDRLRAELDWTGVNDDGTGGRLTVRDADDDDDAKKRPLLEKRSIVSAVIGSDAMTTKTNRGKSEESRAPWA